MLPLLKCHIENSFPRLFCQQFGQVQKLIKEYEAERTTTKNNSTLFHIVVFMYVYKVLRSLFRKRASVISSIFKIAGFMLIITLVCSYSNYYEYID